MSNLIKHSAHNGDCAHKPCDAIELVLTPHEKDLGGFGVRRLLPMAEQRSVGPWIFFDHMGPAVFPKGKGIDVRPHPHINLATVTYLFEGEIHHRDSLGCHQPIRPGDINLMVAGKGIVHSERTGPEIRKAGHTLHGLQLWLGLPEDAEETDPAFYHYPNEEIPHSTIDGVLVRVMMGTAFGRASPVKTYSDTLYMEAHLQAGQSLTLPDAPERAVYIPHGHLCAADTDLKPHSLTVFASGPKIRLEAKSDARIAIIGGSPLGKRHMFWNFASSSKERIEKAKQDWEAGNFPEVPGDEEEFIPLP